MSGTRMKSSTIILALLGVAILIYAFSCQGAGSNSITGPIPVDDSSKDSVSLDGSTPPIYVTGSDQDEIETGIGSFGVYQVSIDSKELKGEMVPVRNPQAVGDSYMVDITGYLSGSPCQDCFRMESVALNADNELEVTFSLRHPYSMPTNKPAQHQDRFDLNVFDTEAIFFFSETDNPVTFPQTSSNIFGPDSAETLEQDNSGFWASEGWDGFTTHFDEYMDENWHTNSDLHPYIVFFEDPTHGNYDPVDLNGFTNLYAPTGNNVFAQGAGPESQTVNLGKPINKNIGFMVLISAAFGRAGRLHGLDLGQLGNPRYYLPEFNRKEPWKVDVRIPAETDLLGSEDTGSSTMLDIYVYDWQHSYGTEVPDFEFGISSNNSLRHNSRISGIYVEVPGVNNIDYVTFPTSGTGIGDDPLRYAVTVMNDLGAKQGRYTGLVAVVDEMNDFVLKNQGVYRDGITTFDLDHFVTYVTFHVNVIERESDGFNVGFSFSKFFEDDDLGEGVALDGTNGKNIETYYNNVYIASSLYNGPGGEGWDVYFFRSADDGLTWETPILVNKDWTGGHLGDQMDACLTVAPDTGNVYVAFTDKSKNRTDDYNKIQAYIRRSVDYGASFGSPAVLLNNKDKGSDQPVIKADLNGVLWAACRQFEGEIPGYGESRLMFYRTEHELNNIREDEQFDVGTKNYQDPIIVVNPYHKGDNQNMVLMWRQPNDVFYNLWWSMTSDGGNHFSTRQYLSQESPGHEAANLNAVMTNDGRIYAVYTEGVVGLPSPIVKLARGSYVTVGSIQTYIWSYRTLLYHYSYQIEDMALAVIDNNHLFAAISMFDSSAASNGRDIRVFESFDGASFIEYVNIEEPGTVPGNQDNPRFIGDPDGHLYLVYKDDSFNSFGELYYTTDLVD